MDEPRLTFKDMCERFDATPRTLRYYEYIELLQPERNGRTRTYGSREIARMTLILRGRRWGFPLEDIRQWLSLYDDAGTETQMEAWRTLADSRLAALEVERTQLDRTIEELRKARSMPADGF